MCIFLPNNESPLCKHWEILMKRSQIPWIHSTGSTLLNPYPNFSSEWGIHIKHLTTIVFERTHFGNLKLHAISKPILVWRFRSSASSLKCDANEKFKLKSILTNYVGFYVCLNCCDLSVAEVQCAYFRWVSVWEVDMVQLVHEARSADECHEEKSPLNDTWKQLQCTVFFAWGLRQHNPDWKKKQSTTWCYNKSGHNGSYPGSNKQLVWSGADLGFSRERRIFKNFSKIMLTFFKSTKLIFWALPNHYKKPIITNFSAP